MADVESGWNHLLLLTSMLSLCWFVNSLLEKGEAYIAGRGNFGQQASGDNVASQDKFHLVKLKDVGLSFA